MIINIKGRRFVATSTTPSIPSGPTSGPLNFNFTLSQSARTSAGVYTTDGTLIRILWSNVDYTAGTHEGTWDGVNDDFVTMPSDNYYVEVLSSNVQYTWEGVIGNTSKNTYTKIGKHRSFLPMTDMCSAGNQVFYNTHYNERTVSQGAFITSDPQVKIDLGWPSDGGISQSTEFCSTDGTRVYWGGDKENSASFLFATLVSDHTYQVQFSSGSQFESYTSIIGAVSSRLSGMSVQASGNYIFKSHVYLNQIHVLNKITGALVRTITYTTPGVIKTYGSFLYVISGTNIYKHSVNTDGTISAALLTISGFNIPFGLGITPDGSSISIMDGTPVHQIKTYNTTTGALQWTLGQLGGYESTSVVANDRFDFYGGFMTYLSDGSFWVGDKGNYRALHFTASRQYIEVISYLPATYKVTINQSDPRYTYADYLEFTRDLTKTLGGSNGSWYLSRNFRATQGNEEIACVTTLNNNRTYAFVSQRSIPNNFYWKVVELTNSGLRSCNNNATFGTGSQQMKRDGRVAQIYSFLGVQQEWREQLLTGFDTSGNPQWGAQTTAASSPSITAEDPWNTGIGGTMRAGEETTSGYFGVLNSFTGDTDTDTKWHFGIVKRGEFNKWRVKTARRTFKNYVGYFPNSEFYDIGNKVGPYSGSVVQASGRSFYWGYHGEFWKNNQCNMWNQIYDNGLPVGQFGSQGGDAGMAGNSFNATISSDSSGTYLVHNDESVHQGVHSWKITNLDTIQVQRINSFITYAELPDDGFKLMKGLPFNAPLVTTSIWTRDQPEFYHQLGNTAELYQVQCYRTRYDPRKPGDISWWQQINGTTGSYIGPYSTSAKLPVTSNLTNWLLYGEVSYAYNLPMAGNVYLDVMDNNNNVIVRFYNQINFDAPTDDKPYNIYANGLLVGSLPGAQAVSLLWNPNILEFYGSSAGIRVRYGSFADIVVPVLDGGPANVLRPASLRVYIFGTDYERRIVLADWTFKSNV